ncbi:vitelline envelope sperm lysin receptor-like [Liolophura sinensis]|uniref:vitelline envelope sperm lysin receptor-like n=1 Tax=Liolophura sinensis TaxID=3198878 RepID=UPI0031596B4B
MDIFLYSYLLMIASCVADDKIVTLTQECPATTSGNPVFRLTADVPAYAEARCKNGRKIFTPDDDGITHILVGSFDVDYSGFGCQVYQKSGSNTFTLDVEYGWGEQDAEVITSTDVETLSCAYDQYGNALSGMETVKDAIMAAQEVQELVGPKNKSVNIDLHVMDVLDETIHEGSIDIGRKIRLYARDLSETLSGFQPVSCVARNDISTYSILVAGCGDGLIIPRKIGFLTHRNKVYSPYFRAFRLQGSPRITFSCNFTICESVCDGDSCSTNVRKRRSMSEMLLKGFSNRTVYTATSSTIIANAESKLVEGDVQVHKQDWQSVETITGSKKLEEPRELAPKKETVLSLPAIAGIIMVFMCLVATVLAVYFVVSSPRSDVSNPDQRMVVNQLS